MKAIKCILSSLLILKAGAYQGRGRFREVIELSLKAKALNPLSKAAHMFLADDYNRLEDYESAKRVLEEALSLYPDDFQFNQLMVMAIVANGEPIGNAVPFIREYLKNMPSSEGKFPAPMKLLLKLLGKDNQLDGFAHEMLDWQTQWTRWAEDTLRKFESDKTI
jgi:tetratricopeptide (TPR) repeat protein